MLLLITASSPVKHHSFPSGPTGIGNAVSGTTANKRFSKLTQYDELCYRLLPYIYSAAWRVTNRGETLMRALPLEFSSDPGARGVSDQFVFGPALLINPVTSEGMTQRELYLLSGVEWVDFWTGKRMSGGQTITAEAPLDRIPIYGRAGSIVPIGPRAESAAAKIVMAVSLECSSTGHFTP